MNNLLKSKREEAGLTQEQLSKKSNVSRQTISMIENNLIDNIESKTMYKLATALNYDVGDIFFKENVVLTQQKWIKEYILKDKIREIHSMTKRKVILMKKNEIKKVRLLKSIMTYGFVDGLNMWCGYRNLVRKNDKFHQLLRAGIVATITSIIFNILVILMKK